MTDRNCLVQVRCRRPGEGLTVGSGWLVGAGYVLTAAHNVDRRADVRLEIADVDGKTYPVRVAAAGDANRFDLAILELVGGPEIAHRPPVPFGRIDRETTGFVEGCTAAGFPTWNKEVLRDAVLVGGTIPTLSNAGSGTLMFNTEARPKVDEREAHSEWAGMSGAVVFAPGPSGPMVVGVITDHHKPAGSSSLVAEPVTRLAEIGDRDTWWPRLKLGQWPRAVVTTQGRSRKAGTSAGKLALTWKKPNFVGRDSEKDRLVAGLTDGLESSSPVAVISGMGGVGKTELANQVAHELGDHFPSARIMVSLGAPDDPVDSVIINVLRGFGLSGFGTGDGQIPPTADARLGRLDDLLGAGGCLLVLDNATSAAQVRPLLPATYGNAIIVTGREPVSGLDATVKVALRPLADDAGVTLLRRIRPDGFDDDAARRIVALTGGLPLAIRIAGEILPHLSLADLVEHLAGEPNLESVMDDPERSVHAVFESSYRTLPAEWARCFRVLGVLDVPEFGHAWIAHIAGVDARQANAWLTGLVGRQLLEPARGGRFRLHDLVRRYATELAGRVAEAREEILVPAVDWYATRIAELMSPRGAQERPPDDALGWFAAERDNLRAVLEAAREIGSWPQLHQIVESCYGLFAYVGQWAELAGVAELGVEAARRIDDPDAEVGRLIHLCEALRYSGRIERTGVMYERALDIARDRLPADRLGWVLVHYGDFLCDAGRTDQALAGPYAEAMALQTGLGGTCWVSAHVVDAFLGLGDPARAIAEGRRVLALCHAARATGAEDEDVIDANDIWTRWHLAIALHQHGDLAEAGEHLLIAADHHRRRDDPGGLATMLLLLGKVYLAQGEADKAHTVLTEAMNAVQRIGDETRQREIRELLDRSQER